MSAISCILHFDDKPIDFNLLERMTARLDDYGLDGSNINVLNNIGIGFQHFWTTAEERGCIQPGSLQTPNILYAFCGRIDNREELFDVLRDHTLPAECPDSTLATRLWLHFKNDAFTKIVGSFVFLIYDILAKTLTVARDPLGDRTIYYYRSNRFIAIATEPYALLVHPDINCEPDNARIASHFLHQWPENKRSFFAGIDELPAGTFLSTQKNSFRIKRYWQLCKISRPRYKSTNELYEAFSETLNRAVKARVRTDLPVAAGLSGGLDSSSIVSFAIKHCNLKTYSWVFKELMECDESPNIKTMVDRYGLQNEQFFADNSFTKLHITDSKVNLNTPFTRVFEGLRQRLIKQVAQDGPSVFLNGDFGDELFVGQKMWLRDHIKTESIHSSFLTISRHIKMALCGNTSSYQALRHVLPSGWKKPFSGMLTTNALPSHAQIPLPMTITELVCKKESQRNYNYYHGSFGNYIQMLKNEDSGRTANLGVDLRMPFTDRNLIEFIYNLPTHLYAYPVESKPLLRSGLKARLPKQIIASKRIGTLSSLARRGLIVQSNELWEIYNSVRESKKQSYVGLKFYRSKKSDKNFTDYQIVSIYQEAAYIIWEQRLANLSD